MPFSTLFITRMTRLPISQGMSTIKKASKKFDPSAIQNKAKTVKTLKTINSSWETGVETDAVMVGADGEGGAVLSSTGSPHLGQAGALELNSFPHSLQIIKAIFISPKYDETIRPEVLKSQLRI